MIFHHTELQYESKLSHPRQMHSSIYVFVTDRRLSYSCSIEGFEHPTNVGRRQLLFSKWQQTHGLCKARGWFSASALIPID